MREGTGCDTRSGSRWSVKHPAACRVRPITRSTSRNRRAPASEVTRPPSNRPSIDHGPRGWNGIEGAAEGNFTDGAPRGEPTAFVKPNLAAQPYRLTAVLHC